MEKLDGVFSGFLNTEPLDILEFFGEFLRVPSGHFLYFLFRYLFLRVDDFANDFLCLL